MQQVVYVGHFDEVEVEGYGLAEPGVAIDVPDELAGRAPSGHRSDEDYDPGEGLLAQPSNWQPYSKPKQPRAPKPLAKAQAKGGGVKAPEVVDLPDSTKIVPNPKES